MMILIINKKENMVYLVNRIKKKTGIIIDNLLVSSFIENGEYKVDEFNLLKINDIYFNMNNIKLEII